MAKQAVPRTSPLRCLLSLVAISQAHGPLLRPQGCQSPGLVLQVSALPHLHTSRQPKVSKPIPLPFLTIDPPPSTLIKCRLMFGAVEFRIGFNRLA